MTVNFSCRDCWPRVPFHFGWASKGVCFSPFCSRNEMCGAVRGSGEVGEQSHPSSEESLSLTGTSGHLNSTSFSRVWQRLVFSASHIHTFCGRFRSVLCWTVTHKDTSEAIDLVLPHARGLELGQICAAWVCRVGFHLTHLGKPVLYPERSADGYSSAEAVL